ncbi:hypothetical protein Cme02nite_38220 [Catellatospora methionotrophica]|uniref:Uncharacterized protein n=1 Tax=Catellatospora methionotrophica TaxID=121620 RepID=A0A8J3LJ88_9ACTN|nr:hypothetical protein [Catellatospora methionotrophica]GIG15490.1 hypothetical protein Cme02nite_38220 [Catellatospora methionotrophica]
MPKNTRLGGTSHDGVIPPPAPKVKPWAGRQTDDGTELREFPGTGVEMVGVEAAPDGSWTTLCSDDDSPTATVTGSHLTDDEGGEEPSPGSSTSTSSEQPETKSGNSSTRNPSRARSAANRSKTTPKANSAADSTAGPTSSN